jgi:YHS domain-containing protein
MKTFSKMVLGLAVVAGLGAAIFGLNRRTAPQADTSSARVSGDAAQPARARPATPAATGVKTVATAQTLCPVMGGVIDKTVFSDYRGKRIYFCCAPCASEFTKDPAKYIKEMEDQGIILEKAPEAAAPAK